MHSVLWCMSSKSVYVVDDRRKVLDAYCDVVHVFLFYCNVFCQHVYAHMHTVVLTWS